MQDNYNQQEDYSREEPVQDSYGSRENYNPNNIHTLDKGQKIAVVILAFFAISVVSLWFVQAKKGLRGSSGVGSAVESQETCSSGNCNASDTSNLKLKDTDQDGLSDYDELNFYNTSPYIADSDSDGFSDKYEVENAGDPTCPKGSDCNAVPQVVEEVGNVLEPIDMGELPSDTPTDVATQINSAQAILSGDVNAQTLRSYLQDVGMDQDVLSQLSDAELMSTYGEVLGAQ